jgi:hypothetical protein
MDYAMTNGVDIGDTLNLRYARLFRAGPTDDQINRRTRITQGCCRPFEVFSCGLQRNNCFASDALDISASKATIGFSSDLIKISRDKLKLH